MLSENEARAAVLAAARGMLERGLTSGTSGNVSARVDGETLVITPTGLPYQEMGPADLVVITMAGKPVTPGAGGLAPSSEHQLHTACYQAFPEIGAVLHSHPPWASMFAAARQPVPAVIDEAVIFLGGEIPVAPYAISGSAGVGANAVAMLAARASALLASHGLVTVAATPAQALHRAVVSEHCAQVAWGARALGGHVPLPSATLETFGQLTGAPAAGQLALASGRVPGGAAGLAGRRPDGEHPDRSDHDAHGDGPDKRLGHAHRGILRVGRRLLAGDLGPAHSDHLAGDEGSPEGRQRAQRLAGAVPALV